MRLSSIVETLGVLLLSVASADATDYYVSPTGNDGNPGTIDQPFATITKAQAAVRAADKSGDINVYLRAGTYAVATPLTFSQQDGGAGSSKVTYQAYDNECVTISGGKRITGWTQGAGNKWTVDIPEAANGAWKFRQLFINDKRMIRGRWPNRDPGADAYQGSNDPGIMSVVKYRTSFTSSLAFPGNLGGKSVEMVDFHQWNISRGIVASTNGATITTSTAMGNTDPEDDWCGADERDHFFLENALEFVDTVGEWYLDNSSGKLTYMAASGEDPNTETVIAPLATQLVTVSGAKGSPVSGLWLKGIRFEHAGWALPVEGYYGNQGGQYHGTCFSNDSIRTAPCALMFLWTKACGLQECRIAHTEQSGIGFGAGCRSNKVIGCEIYDIGNRGVDIGWQGSYNVAGVYTWATDWPDAAMIPDSNEVSNCYLHKCSGVYFDAVGIWTGNTANTKISHNVVTDMTYTGISFGWQWNNNPCSMKGCIVEYNHVYDVVKRLADGGGTYSLGVQPGSILRGNHVHNIKNNPLQFAFEAPNGGIYFDQYSSYTCSDNVIYDVAGFNGSEVNTPSNYFWWGPNTAQSDMTLSNNKVGTAVTQADKDAISKTAGLEASYAWLMTTGFPSCTSTPTTLDDNRFQASQRSIRPAALVRGSILLFDPAGRLVGTVSSVKRHAGVYLTQATLGGSALKRSVVVR